MKNFLISFTNIELVPKSIEADYYYFEGGFIHFSKGTIVYCVNAKEVREIKLT